LRAVSVTGHPPGVNQILETAIYVEDLATAADFYRKTFNFATLVDTPRLVAFDVVGRDVLLLFQRGATTEGLESEGGYIPPHDGSGPAHFAFGIARDDLDGWQQRLMELGVAVESRVKWKRGGVSLYFRDPNGHSVELSTTGTWATY
jgi:catechol 2,3-dioxygenase-like lactoylglutathione lyase family enzyme